MIRIYPNVGAVAPPWSMGNRPAIRFIIYQICLVFSYDV